jgi:putative flippase GtrA
MREREAGTLETSSVVMPPLGKPAVRFAWQKQFIRYVISGSIATVLNLTGVWLSRQLLSYEIAVVIGAIVGTLTSYVLTKTFVFNSDTNAIDHKEMVRFFSVHSAVCLQIWLVAVSLESWLLPAEWPAGLRESLASLVSVGSVAITGFVLHRSVTYRKK